MIFVTGFIPRTVWAAQSISMNHKTIVEQNDGYELDSIYVFYEQTNSTMQVIAESVQEVVGYRVKNVHLIPINSYDDLEFWLLDDPWIAVYAFSANLTHVVLPTTALTWRQFHALLVEHPRTKHVLGMSNTLSLEKYLGPDECGIFSSQSEQTDALLLIIHDLWSVAEIIDSRSQANEEYKNAALELRSIVLQLYSDNFNELFKRSFDPVDVVGQEDPDALEKRTKDMWNRHAPKIEPEVYRLMDNGSLEEIPDDQIPENFSPVIRLGGHPALADGGSDYSLGKLPLFSGLRGPIGEIVDVLLELLASSGDTDVSISSDVMRNIMDIYKEIEPFIGIAANFDSNSPMKSVIDGLATQFPFVEEYKPYLYVLAKCLFALRGDTASIIGALTEAVVSLLPEVLPSDITDFIVDLLGVNDGLGDLIADVIRDGRGAFDALLGFFTDHVLTKLFNKTLDAVFGLAQSDIDILLPRMNAFVEAVIDYLATRDFDTFIKRVGEELLIGAMNIISHDDDQFLNDMMVLFKIGTTVAGLRDEFTTESVIQVMIETLTLLFGESNITTTPEALARDVMGVVKTYKEGEGPSFENVTSFRARVSDVINNSVTTSVPDGIIGVAIDALTLVGGYYVDGFDRNDVPDLFDVIFRLAGELLDNDTAQLVDEALTHVIRPILGIIAAVTDNEPMKEMVSKTLGEFSMEIGDIPGLMVDVLNELDMDNVLDGVTGVNDTLGIIGEIAYGIIIIVQQAQGKSFSGVMHGILIGVGALIGTYPAFDDVPIDSFLRLLEAFFPDVFGIPEDERPSKAEVISEIVTLAAGHIGIGFDEDELTAFIETLMDTKDIFTKGVKWLVGMIFNWLSGQLTPLLQKLVAQIESALGGAGELLGYHSIIPIGLGSWNLFELSIDLGLIANFEIDPQPLFDLISSMIFDARQVLSLDTLDEFFTVIFRCLSISPQFYADLGVNDFDTSKNPMMAFLLESFGIELTFSGSAHFVLNLFTFRNGLFEWEDFMHVVEWGLSIKITMSRMFTFLDFVTGGAAGALNKIAKYIGLDAISVTVFFSVELDIVKRAATAISPEVSTLTLALSIGAVVHIGIDVVIAELAIEGVLELILTFFQDLSSGAPLKIYLELVMTIRVIVELLFVSKKWNFNILDKLWDISPKKGDDEYENSAIGFDSDGDGLGDKYEATIPGLNLYSADTDGDGASDKLEVQTMFSDPTNPDTDGDGLTDGEEWTLSTNWLEPDSDFDSITDYEEVRIYNTDPLCQDSDGDGLTDDYEINTHWNISGITPTVTEVIIGGVSYNDHTDPLVADTDGDGLLDGQEGPMGAYYGLDCLYNDTPGSGSDPDPLIFNNGYTHPLDADTDDDSYLQLYNGAIDTQAMHFLMDMNDGAEVHGFKVIFYDEYGMPEERLVFTNPVNPDSDGDTGVTDRTPQPGFWLNSDGYELAQNPPTDPNNADSDGDGLIDGIEGVLNPLSNHTNPNVADTDGDGLYDMQEILLGCDPRSPDTDGDLITDGDEFYKFFTNPVIDDTDFDGLKDGEEVFLWHSNPRQDDSDGDGISDSKEVLLYGSDPMDEDSDNDGLTDFQEIFIYYTDCFQYDTDNDGLGDADEVFVYDTDPLSWDTDHDSITEPNADGEYTWPMSDYDEIMTYHTNATDPDSDLDGLSDAIELYLGSGQIPWMDPIHLNATNSDTDGDLLKDGQELLLVNVSDIVYPYVSITVVLKYNTDPCNNDTDGDLLTDYQEVMIFNTNANSTDTDNDTIDDWSEVWRYNTSALTNDTDGDGLYDFEEQLYDVWPYGPWPPANWSIGKGALVADVSPVKFTPAQTYGTSATDPDSDDDCLPDGAEVNFYQSDPLSNDTDHDGILDTMEYDYDLDDLPDGLEYSIGTVYLPGGGITNPDSDRDGLTDGAEYYIYGTSPILADTDGDGFSDGFEVAIGSDPLRPSVMGVLSPTVGTVAPNTAVKIINLTAFDTMWYRYRTSSTWSENVSLTYDTDSGQWVDLTASWDPGDYELEIFGRTANGTEYSVIRSFKVSVEIPEGRTMLVMTPRNGEQVSPLTAVRIANLTTFSSMWFRYSTSTTWSTNHTMTYDNVTQMWYNDSIYWEPGTYTLQAFGRTPTGIVYMEQVTFVVAPLPPDYTVPIIFGLIAALGIVTFGLVWTKFGPKIKETVGRKIPSRSPRTTEDSTGQGTTEQSSVTEEPAIDKGGTGDEPQGSEGAGEEAGTDKATPEKTSKTKTTSTDKATSTETRRTKTTGSRKKKSTASRKRSPRRKRTTGEKEGGAE